MRILRTPEDVAELRAALAVRATSGWADVRRHHLACRAPIVFDARMKPTYPKELFPDAAIVERVDNRWDELFPGGIAHNPRPSGEPDTGPQISTDTRR